MLLFTYQLRSTAALVLLALSALGTTCWAESVIFETTYKAQYAGLNITTERRLVELNDGSFRLESRASNFLGSLTETSHFITREEAWLPLSYSYRRRIFGSRTTEKIEFDWDREIASYTHSDKTERNKEHQLEPGILDPALYQLRLQRDLVLGLKELDYRFIKRDRVRHYRIERGARQPVKVKGKPYQALRLQRADPDDDKQTYVWTLPELYHLFGKIVHVEDDDDHQMELIDHKVNSNLVQQFFNGQP